MYTYIYIYIHIDRRTAGTGWTLARAGLRRGPTVGSHKSRLATFEPGIPEALLMFTSACPLE